MFEINECDCTTTNLVEAEKTIAELRARLQQAVSNERERCALIAEDAAIIINAKPGGSLHKICQKIAAKIRKGGHPFED